MYLFCRKQWTSFLYAFESLSRKTNLKAARHRCMRPTLFPNWSINPPSTSSILPPCTDKARVQPKNFQLIAPVHLLEQNLALRSLKRYQERSKSDVVGCPEAKHGVTCRTPVIIICHSAMYINSVFPRNCNCNRYSLHPSPHITHRCSFPFPHV